MGCFVYICSSGQQLLDTKPYNKCMLFDCSSRAVKKQSQTILMFPNSMEIRNSAKEIWLKSRYNYDGRTHCSCRSCGCLVAPVTFIMVWRATRIDWGAKERKVVVVNMKRWFHWSLNAFEMYTWTKIYQMVWAICCKKMFFFSEKVYCKS